MSSIEKVCIENNICVECKKNKVTSTNPDEVFCKECSEKNFREGLIEQFGDTEETREWIEEILEDGPYIEKTETN